MHDVYKTWNMETKNLGNYFDTKFKDMTFCNENLHVKEIIWYKTALSYWKVKIYVNINVSI